MFFCVARLLLTAWSGADSSSMKKALEPRMMRGLQSLSCYLYL